jgi:type IV secretion system protein VirB4
MESLKRFHEEPHRLSDQLPWAALVAPGVVLNKDGSFLSAIRYRGPDLDSATPEELDVVAARMNNVLKRLGEGWVLYVEARRRPSEEYPESEFESPLAAVIDRERARTFRTATHFESDYYLTLIYLPPPDSKQRLVAKFMEATAEQVDYRKILENYLIEVQRVEDLMGSILPEVQRLDDAELLTYLHSTVSTRGHAVSPPEVPFYLDGLLVDSPLLGGLEPKLGDHYLGVLGVLGLPMRSRTGLLDALNRLAIPYRWVNRFIPLGKQEALKELRDYKRKWFSKRKGIGVIVSEIISGAQSVMVDSDALNKSEDADQALQEVADDYVAFGYYTPVVVLMDREREVLKSQVREVERVINSHGFATRVEDLNAVDAWLGAVPGNCRHNVRRPLIHSLNFTHLMPLSAVFAGPRANRHLKGPPLFYASTGGSTPFRFVPHIGDVGHTLILGPTGSGKSTLLSFLEVQFQRYRDAQIYIFDKGGSARIMTYGVGGDYYELGDDASDLSLQPLGHIDEEPERRWAQEWLIDILIQENVAVGPHHKQEVWNALGRLASAPQPERTMTGFVCMVQDSELRRALHAYTVEGAHGGLLDSDRDNLRYGCWQTFETEALMTRKQAVAPVLSYLFHRLEQRFQGQPTLLVLDEAWLFLDHPAFAAKIREWLKVLRKANVMVVFATQSLADVDQSPVAKTIREACFTKIYLPNGAALNEDAFEMYRRFGLNKRQVEIIAKASPKRHYYYTSALGHRLFDLGLGECALAYCAASSKEMQQFAVELRKRARSAAEFNQEYLKALNRDHLAQQVAEFEGGRE